ncbi:hypothetical protein Mal4_09720 [Maioricimonas rarisocia]|uniref:Uncharacterized protein n=1 Tax=Maioricimonas rarisocia TaxID=2528026 RepID=A0A517Z2H7_9PLAN|nr:hypothetical protein [Maioricimonas rarisocia]QDU36684.1 hypothetical protein Mal4_09720 [Maioricimonas rarisocia]
MKPALVLAGSHLVCAHDGGQIELEWRDERLVIDASSAPVLESALDAVQRTIPGRLSGRDLLRLLLRMDVPCTLALRGRPLLELHRGSGSPLLRWLGLPGVRRGRLRSRDIPWLVRLMFSRPR